MSPQAPTQLLDSLTTAILLVDDALRLEYMNAAAETLFEVSAARLVGEPIERLFSEPDDDESGLTRAAAARSGFTKRQTPLVLTSTGQEIVVDCIVTPLGEERERGFLVEIQPLDRLMRISREEALVASHQMTRTMIRGLAHEIKNPLGGLRGAAQLLAREIGDEHLKDYTRVIIDEADRLRRLVDRMLGSPLKLQRETLNVHEVTERVRQLIVAETDGVVRVERDYDPSIPELLADKERLIQATLNIARNAAQALRGRDAPTITLRTRSQRQLTIGHQRHRLVCRIDVCDNGPGIPEDIRESLFFPLVSGRPDGSGLGLPIAQAILNQHGGLIGTGVEDGLTVFSMYLPMEADS